MKRLFAAAAVAPLCFAASQASAQTTVNTATTTPLVSSSAGNITITTDGSISLTSGVGVTIDSNNTLKHDGSVVVQDAATSTAILVDVPAAGRSSTLTLNGLVRADDAIVPTDTDSDGDLDGPFAPAGTQRYGVRVAGPGVFTGDLTFGEGSEVAVKGVNGSAGVLIDSALVGNLTLGGRTFTSGDDSFGLHVVGPVTGDVTVAGGVAVQGAGATSVAIDGPVSGQLKISGVIQTTGYRTVNRPTTEAARAKLDADDLLIGGPAVRIRGSLGKGFLLYAPPLETDVTDLDEDDDGIEDPNQTTTGSIAQYGTAPAILIGDASNITIGTVGTGAYNNYGVVLRGTVAASGVYDGFSATGIQIGGLGGVVDIASGISLRGTVNAGSFYADATGIRLGAGATTPFLEIKGGVQAANATKEGGAPSAIALDIQAGATLPSLVNNGVIIASVSGPTGVATGVRDASGTLTSITNTGAIGIEALSESGVSTDNRAIAFDLSANTTGVTINQYQPATTTPTIVGDILLGAGSDTINLQHGTILGKLSFGAGNDAITVTNGSVYRGEIIKGAGNLALNITDGIVSLANKGVLNASSLNLGANSSLLLSADPGNTDPSLLNGRIDVAGTATLEQGSRISLTFSSKIDDPRSFTVIQAGNLVNNGAALLAGTPFIYSATLGTTATTAVVTVRRRTVDELGLSGGRAAAYDAFYSVFDDQLVISDAVFSKTEQAGFSGLYNQFLPDYSGGVFQSVALASRGVMQGQTEDVEDMPAAEPRSWLQEISSGVSNTSTTEVGYHSNGFGLAGGYDVPVGANGARIGVSAAILSSEIRNQDRGAGSVLSVNTAMAGAYWRDQIGPVMLDASLNAGYLWVDSERTIVDQTAGGYLILNAPAVADWSGGLAAARVGASSLYKFGAFYLRPEAVLDYVYLSESGYTERAGGAAINLQVDGRSSYEAAAEAGLTFGAKFGRTFKWGPELRVAYRSRLAGSMGDTTARFVSNTAMPFVLPALAGDDGRTVVRAAIRGGGAYSNIALEATGEYGGLQRAYAARFVVRFLF